MRGQRNTRENNGEEVDEHFWAQAAAQQANARQGSEDESQWPSKIKDYPLTSLQQRLATARSPSILSSSTTTMMAVASTVALILALMAISLQLLNHWILPQRKKKR